ncbi:TetR/AcrR family transcriptional regulator C-terminal domain-containing protein [Catellatospora vulcania]|uniref:TetR/AcrR family transcriptional regulator C-terminal domain-containing protein n=1 Tax=Catellatospora vulcania TaxID=1460450 RepID=UPI0012D41AD4|nr:TetR/AcrR family transcriptional regulator C-terminal domain-containing protein [Catellatospora vulcania]
MSEIPAPPWRAPRRSAPARKPLSRDAIVDAALGLLDREGLDAVSMRRVAEELNTGAASLYAHVANKDELLELAYDRVLGEIELPEPDPARWREQVREIARASYQVLGRHGDIARVSLANVPTGPNAVKMGEAMLGVLISGGVPPQQAAWAVDRISMYISADAYEGSLYQSRQRTSGKPIDEFIADYFGQIHEYYRSLPPERFPFLTRYADVLVQGDGEERFEFGLELIINGLARYLPAAD